MRGHGWGVVVGGEARERGLRGEDSGIFVSYTYLPPIIPWELWKGTGSVRSILCSVPDGALTSDDLQPGFQKE